MMIKQLKISVLVLVFISLLSSCVRYKNYVLLNDERYGAIDTAKVLSHKNYKLKKHDVLNIQATSTDQESMSIFVRNAGNSGSASNGEVNSYLNGYSVSDSGTISLPIIGDIYVLGKTTSEVKHEVVKELSSYFKFVVVDIKLVSFRLSFLGEFSNVGTQTVFRDKINMIEALSLAGGFTEYAKRHKVKILREINGKVVSRRIDFTDPELIYDNWYHLQPNDVLYAEPLRIKNLQTNSSTLSLVFSTASFIILLINLTTR